LDKMPRAKQTKAKSVPADAPTSDDAVPVVVHEAEAPLGDVFEPGTAPSTSSVDEEGKSKPKKSTRKPKPCTRCDERRKREREYARASRVRTKLAKAPAVADGAASAASAESAAGGAPAVAVPMDASA
jgi:hypothetical protein